MQDIAIVPFLVLLPVVESPEMDGQSTMALVTSLGPTALKTLGGLGLLLLGGRFILRRIFELVAQARSDDTFFSLCLLTVTGASLCTQRLGFSDTLGAFSAGVLLAETNYRTQVVCRLCLMTKSAQTFRSRQIRQLIPARERLKISYTGPHVLP